VVLTDAQMPEIDGLEATLQIKALLPQVEIVVRSEYPEYRGEPLAVGADAVEYCRL
jgi:CheY-like chemotaxis protein